MAEGPPRQTLAGWGRQRRPGTELLSPDLQAATRGARLTRGLGRSYGDASLPARPDDRVVNCRLADRILGFDPATGVLRAQAGLSLAALLDRFLPQGWFPPVTPGTRFVTLGGMVAADVHGKNHHREGTIGAHLRALRLRLASDEIVDCSPTVEPDLFWATVGGMGLTGHILEVELTLRRIPSPWIVMESERVDDIDAFLAALSRAAPAWPMTMGWIDCLRRGRRMGRGILMAGRWARPEEAPSRPPPGPRQLRLAVDLPDRALNPLTTRVFNTLYWRSHRPRTRRRRVAPEPFFYPLDRVGDWNRIYGRRGFTQYQAVIPAQAGPEAVRAFMQHLTDLGGASPLCVIKDCGPQGQGLLSFPLQGTSVAVDMPLSGDTQRIVDELNAFVIDVGGRIYLAKDSHTRAADFRRMEPRLDRFLEVRERYDPQRRIRSALSVRLFGG
ncbi:MAG: FAD-binding oxidoreductase [Deltaproteobacteria bacterium]|nr:MAG: FAD-binding oxidoreductase [Deltaproteobacteria bacterium]